MTALLTAYGVTAGVALLWTLVRLVRSPRNLPLWGVTGLIASWVLAFPFGLAANADMAVLGMSPITALLIQHALLLVGVNSLVCVYLFSALPPHSARSRALRHVLPLLGALAVMTAAALATPVGTPTNDRSVLPVGLLFATADAYMGFGFAAALLWARRYARVAEPRLARGLRVTSIGLAALVLANCLFIPSITLNVISGYAPTSLLASPSAAEAIGRFAAVVFLLPGIVVFLTRVTYPALVRRLAALRVWWRHRRVYHQLAPLWTLLHEAFPQDRLARLPAHPWWDTLSPVGLHRRYYRRVVECRDGLVRLSPYLVIDSSDDEDNTLAEVAAHIPAALHNYRADEPAAYRPAAVAVPADDTLDADAEALVAVADALKTTGAAAP